MSDTEYVTKLYQVMGRDYYSSKDFTARERWSYAPDTFESEQKAEDWIKAKLHSIPKDGPDAPLLWIRSVYKLVKS